MKRLPIVAAGLAVIVGLLVSSPPLVHAQPVATITLPSPGADKQLYTGCNNIALTFPNGTASQTVVDAVTPAGAVEAMWRHNAALSAFEGFSPAAPQASDLLTVSFLDSVWVCVAGAPPAAPTSPAATATPAPAATATPRPTPTAVSAPCTCTIARVTAWSEHTTPLLNEFTGLMNEAQSDLLTGRSLAPVMAGAENLEARLLSLDVPPCASVAQSDFVGALTEFIAALTDLQSGQLSSGADHMHNASDLLSHAQGELGGIMQEALACG